MFHKNVVPPSADYSKHNDVPHNKAFSRVSNAPSADYSKHNDVPHNKAFSRVSNAP